MRVKTIESFRKTLAEALKDGISTEFLDKSGLSWQTVSRWIQGIRVPDLRQVEATAHALGMNPQALLFPESDPAKLDVLMPWQEIADAVGPVDKTEVQPLVAAIWGARGALISTGFISRTTIDPDLKDFYAAFLKKGRPIAGLRAELAKLIFDPAIDDPELEDILSSLKEFVAAAKAEKAKAKHTHTTGESKKASRNKG